MEAVGLKKMIYVACGAVIGALARYGLGAWMMRTYPSTFPWGTLLVNLIGCSLMGIAVGMLSVQSASSPLRLFFIVGMLGSFTTFSAFSYEMILLMQQGRWAECLLYGVGSVIGGCVLLGTSAYLVRTIPL
jgi:fluoride exporter